MSPKRSASVSRAAVPLLLLAAAAGCQKNPLEVRRTVCPAVAVPVYAGDVTLFNGDSRDAGAQDVVATITNVRGACTEGQVDIVSNVTYDVVARRTSAQGPRTIALPVFASVVQGGVLIVSKQIGQVQLSFADGQLRAIGHGGAQAKVSRAAATLPPQIQERLTRERKPGDFDAAVDPMSDPVVRQAVKASSFEVLVGFQLSDAQLAYNVTK